VAKEYLGDGVYVDQNAVSGALVLTTEDGYHTTNVIYLEAEVLNALLLYLKANKEA
jgi:hypothetical protein